MLSQLGAWEGWSLSQLTSGKYTVCPGVLYNPGNVSGPSQDQHRETDNHSHQLQLIQNHQIT